MTREETELKERLAAAVAWGKVRRRERILLAAFFYAVVGSFAAIPFGQALPYGLTPLAMPIILCPLIAAAAFLSRPWSRSESLRTVLALDKTLRLEERALTAWEILGRARKGAPESLVVAEAAEKLKGVHPRSLYPRRVPWQAWMLLPVLSLFVLLVWLDAGGEGRARATPTPAGTVAERVKEFSRRLRQRAEAEGLTETHRMASEMEELADKRLSGRMGEHKLREGLSGLSKDLLTMGLHQAPAGPDLAASTRESLLDLKMEIETLAEALSIPEGRLGDRKLPPGLAGRLGSLPRLSEELKKRRAEPEKLAPEELRRLLSELERSLSAELDRRALTETREFLRLLLEGDGRGPGDAIGERAGARPGGIGDPERAKGAGTLPGDRPGTKETAPPSALARPGAAAHLKGMLQEGGSTSFRWHGETKAGKSKVAVEDLIVSYRRQAEEDLANEKIPDGLRETVRNYFLSMGMAERKTE